jgi:hypothetical protein
MGSGKPRRFLRHFLIVFSPDMGYTKASGNGTITIDRSIAWITGIV